MLVDRPERPCREQTFMEDSLVRKDREGKLVPAHRARGAVQRLADAGAGNALQQRLPTHCS